jgi:hypothetical protein
MPTKRIGVNYFICILCLVISSFFLFISALGLFSKPTDITVVLVFLGTLITYFLLLIPILPNSIFVKLNSEGIEIVSFYRHKFIRYEDIELIGIFKTRRSKAVGIKYNQLYLQNNKLNSSLYDRIGASVSGFNQFLPTLFLAYGPEKLNYILNSYLIKYRHLQNPEEILDEAPDLSTL